MGGMSTRNEIKARLGILAEPKTANARPGAKAKFASKRTTAGALRKQLRAQGITSPADLEWHGISASDPDNTPYWLHEDGSMEKIRASRPGAKAKMGKYATQLGWIASQAQDQVELAKKNIRILAKTMHQDPAQRNSRDLSDMRRLFELADKLSMETEIVTIYERGYFSRPGAKATHAAADKPGRKVMAESDPAVSAKIRKLMAEGKPQKQAVAIALDMKRRGEI